MHLDISTVVLLRAAPTTFELELAKRYQNVNVEQYRAHFQLLQ